MNKVLLLIDGNHALHRAYHKFRGFRSMDGKSSSCLYGFPLMVNSNLRLVKPTKCIAIFDGRSNDYRKSLLPDYRNRPHNRIDFDYDDFINQRDKVMELLSYLGIPVVRDPKGEADDLIYALYRRYVKRGYKIYILSGDKDFNQMLTDKAVTIIHPSKQAKITQKTIKRHYGYEAYQTVDYLTLVGDSSDHIPGLKGCGDKTALSLLEKYGSIEKYLASGETFKRVDPEKLREVSELGKRLIDLEYYYSLPKKPRKIPFAYRHPKFDWASVLDIGATYNIRLFTKPEFKEVFQNLYHGKN